jgi:hypothetical protein
LITFDAEIRLALRNLLEEKYAGWGATVLRDEMGICAGLVRVDLAVIGDELSGYEIKSDQDSLVRLPGQVAAYSRVLDRATLVVTEKHLAKATALIPTWWGLSWSNRSRPCCSRYALLS